MAGKDPEKPGGIGRDETAPVPPAGVDPGGTDLSRDAPERAQLPRVGPSDPGRFPPDTVLASRFRVVRPLGKGGMGEVYLAEDTRLHRLTAVKLLPEELSCDAEWLARFEREARTAARLNHPNIATIYDFGEAEGTRFIAMEYVEGKTLREAIRERKAPGLPHLLDIALQIAEGLAAAHGLKIVHRDLKPANVMVTEARRVKILDFGLAKALRSDTATGSRQPTDLTGKSKLLGTVSYMSPEQARGLPVDPRSDLFSFGVLLYEAVTGTAPFERATAADTLTAVLQEEPRSVREHDAELPLGLDRIIERLLAKAPGDRYQTVGELLADLHRLRRDVEDRADSAPPERTRSIAVLPFADMSPGRDQEYLCDGLAEELINALTQVEALRVVSRTSAFQFKDQAMDVRAIGRKLGVETILEGSVRKAGQRLRITAQLVDVADGYHLWSHRYDRELEDIFDLQDEIARTIVDTLRVKLIREGRGPLVRRYTENVEAYNLYLKGRHCWNKRHRGFLRKGIEYFEQAIAIDPSYALAHAGLADSHSILGLYGFSPTREALATASAEAARALEIDETLAEAHFSVGVVMQYCLSQHDLQESARAYQRAIDLSPKDAWAHCWLSQALCFMGCADDAMRAARRSQELDPLSPVINSVAAFIFYYLRKFDEALAACRRASEIEPDHLSVLWILGTIWMGMGRYSEAARPFERAAQLSGRGPYYLGMLGASLGASGRQDEGRKILEELISRSTTEYVGPLFLAWVHAGLGETEAAGRMYEAALAEENIFMWNPMDPLFDGIRSDARFREYYDRWGQAVSRLSHPDVGSCSS